MAAQRELISSVSADITSVAASLSVLAGEVAPEVWDYLRIVRRQLQANAEQVAHMEQGLTLEPKPQEVRLPRARILHFVNQHISEE